MKDRNNKSLCWLSLDSVTEKEEKASVNLNQISICFICLKKKYQDFLVFVEKSLVIEEFINLEGYFSKLMMGQNR